MEDQLLAKQITKNLTEIKTRIYVTLDTIIDFLIEKNVIQINMKSDIDAKGSPSLQIDHLIQLVIGYGSKKCELFLQALGKSGFGDLEDKIRKTDIIDRDESLERTTTDSGETLQSHLPDIRVKEPERTIMRFNLETTNLSYDGSDLGRATPLDRNNSFLSCITTDEHQELKSRMDSIETGRLEDKQRNKDLIESIRNDLKCQLNEEKKALRTEIRRQTENLQKERQDIRIENDNLRLQNEELNKKFNELEDEFDTFKLETSQHKSAMKTQNEHLKKKNTEVQEELENTRHLLQQKTNEHEQAKKQIEQMIVERSLKLLNMRQWLEMNIAEDDNFAGNWPNPAIRGRRLPILEGKNCTKSDKQLTKRNQRKVKGQTK